MDTALTSLTWYGVRGTGLAASVLLILVVLGGIGQITGWTYKIIEPVKAWLVHKWLSIMLLVMVGIHAVLLLFDSYLRFALLEVLVPFVKTYSNKVSLFGLDVSSLAIPAGILAFYGLIYVVITSLTIMTKRKKFWKYSHFVSYAVMVLVGLHMLAAGTDFKSGILRWLLIVCLIGLCIAAGMRTRRRQHIDLQRN